MAGERGAGPAHRRRCRGPAGNIETPVIGRRRVTISRSRSAHASLDPAVHQPVGEGAHGATGPLDLLEAGPHGIRDLVGERLEVPRAATGVGDPADVGLVGEQDLGVAGEPPAEPLGQAEHGVVGQHGDGVGAADRGAEGGQGAAQHVDPGVLAGEHPQAGDGVGAHAAPVLGDAAGLADAGPHPAHGAQRRRR